MRTTGILAAFSVASLAVAGLVLLGWQAIRPPLATPPSFDCPEQIDLGPREFGSIVVGRFQVTNRGGSDLHLANFGTSCSCAGVEVEQDGVAKRAEDLRVPAGGHVDLSVRVSIAIRIGGSQTVLVRFTTTDPAHPDALVRVEIPQVTGGLTAEPAAVVFGDVPVGHGAAKTVRLYSHGGIARRVHSVRSLQPNRFDVRLLPVNAVEPSTDESKRLVAIIEVIARVAQPGQLDGTIEVLLADEGRAPDKIAVLGEVVSPILAQPGVVVLPRYAAGKAVYTAQIVLTGRDGIEPKFVVDSIPDGVTAVVRPDEKAGQWLLDVTARPDGHTARTVTVRLRADGLIGGSTVIDIPITILATGP